MFVKSPFSNWVKIFSMDLIGGNQAATAVSAVEKFPASLDAQSGVQPGTQRTRHQLFGMHGAKAGYIRPPLHVYGGAVWLTRQGRKREMEWTRSNLG